MAQRAAKVRAARPKVRKLIADAALAAEVTAGLVKRWSPAEIAARLAVDHPGNEAMRVSTRRSTPPSTCRDGAGCARS